MPQTIPDHIYKITTTNLWDEAAATGTVRGMPIDTTDGFMHFSTAGQLEETLALHFRGQSGLVVLAVPTAAVDADLKWEPSRGGALFPHLYAPLPTGLVAWSRPVSVDDNGRSDLPQLA